MTSVAVVDYGTGNVHSVGRMLSGLGVEWKHTRDPVALRSATHLLMPGVGHCGQAMRSLRESGTLEVLNDLVMVAGLPVLGICLGMQLMTSRSAEGPTDCMGWFDAETRRIAPEDRRVYKVPNIGWHVVNANPASRLLAGIDSASRPFYFCHAYAVASQDMAGVSATFDYEARYCAVLERDNIVGVQFHPEKSQEVGVALIRNFLGMGQRDV